LKECNKPKRAPPSDKHKFIVRSCYNNIEKTIRFGARGYEDFTQHHDIKRKKSFRARHQCDAVTDKNTARYWSCEYLWSSKIRR